LALWRLVRGVWLSTWRVYRGAVDWKPFPKDRLFGTAMLLLSTAACGLDGLLSGGDAQNVASGLAVMLFSGAIALHVRNDLQWIGAVFSVLALGTLCIAPFDGISHYAALSPIWRDVGQLCGVIATAGTVWMMWTLFRLSLAKVKEINKRHPLR
jgi:hypothetical protein